MWCSRRLQGLGFDVLAEVLRCVGLTHLVQLQAANQNRNLPTGAFWLPEEPREGQQQAPVIYQMPAITTPDGVGPLAPAAQATSSGEPASAKLWHASGWVPLPNMAAASAVQAWCQPIFQAVLWYTLPYLLLRRRLQISLSTSCACMLDPAPVTRTDPLPAMLCSCSCCKGAHPLRGAVPAVAGLCCRLSRALTSLPDQLREVPVSSCSSWPGWAEPLRCAGRGCAAAVAALCGGARPPDGGPEWRRRGALQRCASA